MSRKSPDVWVNFRTSPGPRVWALGPFDNLTAARALRDRVETMKGAHSCWIADRLYAGRKVLAPHHLSLAFVPPPPPIIADTVIVTAAVRYAMGRADIVEHVVDWVIGNLVSLPREMVDSMADEVSEYLSRQLVRQRAQWVRLLQALVEH